MPQQQSMHSISDENMTVAMNGATSSMSNIDPKQFQDLLQNYQSTFAVECLQYCEFIIDDLQKQLDEKVAHIASLEGKIVTMSLELASAKAFEDEHKSKRRARASSSEVVGGGSGDEECQCQCQCQLPPPRNEKKQPIRAARRNTFLGVVDFDPPSPVATTAERRLARSLPQMDESAKWSFSSLEEPSSSSRRLSVGNIGNFLFGNKRQGGHREQQPEEKETTTKSVDETPRQQVVANDNVSATNNPQRGGRRPPNRRRMERQTNSRSFLECDGVVFPNSFEDVLTKGCFDSPRSSLKAMSEEEKMQLKALEAVPVAPEIDC